MFVNTRAHLTMHLQTARSEVKGVRSAKICGQQFEIDAMKPARFLELAERLSSKQICPH